MLLENKVAIVTGAARGIGYAIVRRFLEEGARVVVADIDHVAGTRAAEELSTFGPVPLAPPLFSSCEPSGAAC